MHDDHAARMRTLIDGYLHTQLIALAIRWGVPESLASGAKTATEVASGPSIEPLAVHRVLRGLAAIGILEETGDGEFRLTPLGELLRPDVPSSMRGPASVRAAIYYPAAARLHDALATGQIPFDLAFEADFFTYLQAEPAAGAVFQASMASRSQFEADAIVRLRDFSEYREIVDVGGGSGVLLEALLEATPTARGTLFDLPEVIDRAASGFQTGPLAGRVTTSSGSFFESVPTGGDAYALSRVLHDWDDEQCAVILRNLRHAMNPGTALFLVEAVLPERAADAPAVVSMDLHMLLLLPGRERTEAEFARLLDHAGFALQSVVDLETPTGASLIEARAM
jgi:hypothetical protein